MGSASSAELKEEAKSYGPTVSKCEDIRAFAVDPLSGRLNLDYASTLSDAERLELRDAIVSCLEDLAENELTDIEHKFVKAHEALAEQEFKEKLEQKLWVPMSGHQPQFYFSRPKWDKWIRKNFKPGVFPPPQAEPRPGITDLYVDLTYALADLNELLNAQRGKTEEGDVVYHALPVPKKRKPKRRVKHN